ncbi:hypothetical protein NDU88_002387 [Pleurodeles waltl]|uniref:Uncharacterized protein n=1 Tax=Pleurodeles waltl TaxID=8319 RepID=A0AAV7UB00_PLEWA|nr:hypothetical protein NDU88_002387 [Pleurodeles waltl]
MPASHPCLLSERQAWRKGPLDRAGKASADQRPLGAWGSPAEAPVVLGENNHMTRRSLAPCSHSFRGRLFAFLVVRTHRVTEREIRKNLTDHLESWLGLKSQMSPHWEFQGTLAICANHLFLWHEQPDRRAKSNKIAGFKGFPSGPTMSYDSVSTGSQSRTGHKDWGYEEASRSSDLGPRHSYFSKTSRGALQDPVPKGAGGGVFYPMAYQSSDLGPSQRFLAQAGKGALPGPAGSYFSTPGHCSHCSLQNRTQDRGLPLPGQLELRPKAQSELLHPAKQRSPTGAYGTLSQAFCNIAA